MGNWTFLSPRQMAPYALPVLGLFQPSTVLDMVDLGYANQ